MRSFTNPGEPRREKELYGFGCGGSAPASGAVRSFPGVVVTCWLDHLPDTAVASGRLVEKCAGGERVIAEFSKLRMSQLRETLDHQLKFGVLVELRLTHLQCC